jgi:histone-lysine N-methyltransferase SETD1
MKAFKPFRIRQNSIVAIRYQPPPSSSSSSSSKVTNGSNCYEEAWLDPIPGRDIHFNLIGKVIRCMFPKSLQQHHRIVEGEIISTRYFPRNNLENNGFQVDLLIDEDNIVKMPFLKSFLVDDDKGESKNNKDKNNNNNKKKKNPQTNTSAISKSERRKKLYEAYIRGKNKVVIQIILSDIVQHSNRKRIKANNDDNDNDDDNGDKGDSVSMSNMKQATKQLHQPPVKWVIRKWVHIQKNINVNKSNANNDEYLDSNVAQQEKNMRWLSSLQQYNFTSANHDDNDDNQHYHQMSSADHYKIGQVMNIQLNQDQIEKIENNVNNQEEGPPTSKKSETSSSSSSSSSLAMVKIKPMILPELTYHGRLAHHGYNEIFHIDTNRYKKNDGSNNTNEEEEEMILNVPIEKLIVIAGKVHCTRIETNNELYTRYTYNTSTKVFHPIIHHQNEDKKKLDISYVSCHGCNRILNGDSFEMAAKCSHCSCIENESKRESCFWCHECCQCYGITMNTETHTEKETKDWIGPCCTGLCHCKTCTTTRIKAINQAFLQIPLGHCSINKKQSYYSNNMICPICCYAVAMAEGGNLALSCVNCSQAMHETCRKWYIFVQYGKDIVPTKTKNSNHIQKDTITFGCQQCSQKKVLNKSNCVTKHNGNKTLNPDNCLSNKTLLGLTKTLLEDESVNPIDFDLPFNILDDLSRMKRSDTSSTRKKRSLTPLSSSCQSSKKQKNEKKKSIANEKKKSIARKKSKSCSPHGASDNKLNIAPTTTREESITESSMYDMNTNFESARCIPYHSIVRNGVRQSNNSAAHAARSIASIRRGGRKSDASVNQNKPNNTGSVTSSVTSSSSSSRAARASLRRRNKQYVGLGLEQSVDMVGREDVLRFGKSLIHGWGVFTDGYINSGGLIVEYRGILIGNTVSDKREKEYEKAKIGSDYMFRIDSGNVCDATHHGNLARFINASCTPNCYTKIITLNGLKRIAIYAKRDIMPGEELMYDYKFEAEFDESKRIRKFLVLAHFSLLTQFDRPLNVYICGIIRCTACNCGTTDCRGFMNWNKKYVAIKTPGGNIL